LKFYGKRDFRLSGYGKDQEQRGQEKQDVTKDHVVESNFLKEVTKRIYNQKETKFRQDTEGVG